MEYQVGYCTNVHAGATYDQMLENLRRHAVEVKSQCAPGGTMGIGLWLANSAAQQMLAERRVNELAGFLEQHGLVPFTLNGFPFGDFHREIVKHDVYQPTWWDPRRSEYTRNLIDILDGILPEGMEGSISTLPIAWGEPRPPREHLAEAAQQLLGIADYLRQLEEGRGRLIYLCLEPEPGCVFSLSQDIVDFFEAFLSGPEAERARRYLRICHDVCHAAVMFEAQQDVLQRYRAAGLQVGKVQVSSAVVVPLSTLPPDERRKALEELSRFAEDRYLHQTVVRDERGERFFQDLPEALAAYESGELPASEWRVHFHVPVYLTGFGRLGASQAAIDECLAACRHDRGLRHFEVETYAWNVLPKPLQQPTLADGIAAEMHWFAARLESVISGE
jgi:hypothetical protein